MKRKLVVLLQLACLFLASLSLITGFKYYGLGSTSDLGRIKGLGHEWPFSSAHTSNNSTGAPGWSEILGQGPNLQGNIETESLPPSLEQSPPTPSMPGSKSALKDGSSTLLEIAPSYIKAIMTPEDSSFPRLDCSAPNRDRYIYLRGGSTSPTASSVQRKYYFALDLHQCAGILPRLFGSIVESLRFLGPENCALSVVEGRSDDGTFEILKLLREDIEKLGAKYFFTSNEIDPMANGGHDRIQRLANLRNQALQPLIDSPDQYSAHTTVIFLNDVAVCTDDILELIHQREYQSADMTCAMDWTYVGADPTFYDIWIARGLNGDSFFNIPEDGNWNSAWNLFWNNPTAAERLRAGVPFQVFSCWNGATAFTAKPFLEHTIKFRNRLNTECYQGEPKLFAKDMWYHGYGKIAVVPSVNLEYTDEAAKKIKSAKGYVSQWTEGEGRSDVPVKIAWESAPPPLVKCMPSYSNQTWPPWDEGLKEK